MVTPPPSKDNGSDRTLSDHVRDCVEEYFKHLNGHDSSGLYSLVLAEVEKRCWKLL